MKRLALLFTIVLIAGCIGQADISDSEGAPEAPETSQPMEEAPQKTITETSPVSLGISVTDAPTIGVAGSRFAVSWEITSPESKDVAKTGIYYGRLSHAGEVATALSPSALDYQSSTMMEKGTAPSTFTSSVLSGDLPGKRYFRAYALIDGLNYWTDEYVVEIVPKPSINITSYPESVGTSSTFKVNWDISDGYPGKVEKTYVMWGIRSDQYTDFSGEQTGNTPQSFDATLTAPASSPETLYFIVTSVVDGRAFNSTEKKVSII